MDVDEPPDFSRSLTDEMARIRKDVLPFWAGTRTATMIMAAIDEAVDSIISGDDVKMMAALAKLQRFGAASKPK